MHLRKIAMLKIKSTKKKKKINYNTISTPIKTQSLDLKFLKHNFLKTEATDDKRNSTVTSRKASFYTKRPQSFSQETTAAVHRSQKFKNPIPRHCKTTLKANTCNKYQ